MEGGHHQGLALFEKNAMLFGDLQVRLNQLLARDASQTHQDLGPQQGELVAQVADAGILLSGQGVPVLGRAALDNVGDVHVGVPVQVHGGQHFVQQLSAPAHKGFTLQVLVFTGAFSHEHHFGFGISHPEHHMVPRLAQGTFFTGQTGLLQFLPMVDHTAFSLGHVFLHSSTGGGAL